MRAVSNKQGNEILHRPRFTIDRFFKCQSSECSEMFSLRFRPEINLLDTRNRQKQIGVYFHKDIDFSTMMIVLYLYGEMSLSQLYASRHYQFISINLFS